MKIFFINKHNEKTMYSFSSQIGFYWCFFIGIFLHKKIKHWYINVYFKNLITSMVFFFTNFFKKNKIIKKNIKICKKLIFYWCFFNNNNLKLLICIGQIIGKSILAKCQTCAPIFLNFFFEFSKKWKKMRKNAKKIIDIILEF